MIGNSYSIIWNSRQSLLRNEVISQSGLAALKIAEPSSTTLTFFKFIFPLCVMIITRIATFLASWYSGFAAEHLERHCYISETAHILGQIQIYREYYF